MNELVAFIKDVIVPGLSTGSVYAMGAIGVTLIFSILRFAHFAHGELMTLGAFITLALTEAFPEVGPLVGLPTAFVLMPMSMLLTAVAAIGIDGVFYKPLRAASSKPIVYVMASIGVTLMLQGLIRLFFGTEAQSLYVGDTREVWRIAFPEDLTRRKININEARILVVITALVCVVALHVFLQKAKLGKAMRAMSDEPDLARISGVDTRRVVMATWIIGGALAAAAGTLLTLDSDLKPDRSFHLLLPIFAATIVGGVGSAYGAIVGGFLIAFAESLAIFNWAQPLRVLERATERWFGEALFDAPNILLIASPEYKLTVPFVILIVVLVVRPTGLLRGKVI